MAALHFFLGPNAYTLSQERSRWLRGFREKHGAENLVEFSGRKTSFRELTDEVAVAPFIAGKRLVVVDGVPKGKKGDVSALQKSMHPDVLLLFTLETDIGKRAKLTVAQKELRTLADCREFPALNRRQIERWMQECTAEHGSSLSPEARTLLLDLVGEDQGLLAQEMEKMSLYAGERGIAPDDVRTLAACSVEREVWKLMDFLGDGRVEDALLYVRSLLDRGFSPQALWSMFLWMLSLLVEVVACVEEGQTDPWAIAKEVRANGYGIKAILPSAQNMDRAFLQQILDSAIAADRGLKTGSYKHTADAPQEILAIIDRSILAFG